jgi:hypothetical protein
MRDGDGGRGEGEMGDGERGSRLNSNDPLPITDYPLCLLPSAFFHPSSFSLLPFAFCLLPSFIPHPFPFCLLPFAFSRHQSGA